MLANLSRDFLSSVLTTLAPFELCKMSQTSRCLKTEVGQFTMRWLVSTQPLHMIAPIGIGLLLESNAMGALINRMHSACSISEASECAVLLASMFSSSASSDADKRRLAELLIQSLLRWRTNRNTLGASLLVRWLDYHRTEQNRTVVITNGGLDVFATLACREIATSPAYGDVSPAEMHRVLRCFDEPHIKSASSLAWIWIAFARLASLEIFASPVFNGPLYVSGASTTSFAKTIDTPALDGLIARVAQVAEDPPPPIEDGFHSCVTRVLALLVALPPGPLSERCVDSVVRHGIVGYCSALLCRDSRRCPRSPLVEGTISTAAFVIDRCIRLIDI